MKLNKFHLKMKQPKGFSLIELMIVVAIIAILASIAFPSYQDSVQKARRTDGIEAVLDCAAAMKQKFTVTNSFSGGNVPTECNNPSSEGFYNIAIDASTPTTFTVSATPPAGSPQTKDTDCPTFTVSNTGLQLVGGAPTNVGTCWR